MLVVSAAKPQEVIPRPDSESGPTKVMIASAVLNINEINASTQTMTANVYFVASWKDSRLSHQGPQKIIRPMKEIWNPSLAIVNRQSITATMPDVAEITPDGTVYYKQRIFGQFSQNLDFSDFPYDRQSFIIKIVSTGNSPDEVEFVSDSVYKAMISEELTIKDWKIFNVNNSIMPYLVVRGSKPVSSLTVEISAQRQYMYYVYNFMIPLIFIIFMSMAVFWLDPKMAAAQISVSVTSMLTLIAYRFMIAGSLPKLSYLTRMDIFIFGATVLIFLTLIQAVLTSVLAGKGNETIAKRLDINARWLFPLIYIIVFIYSFYL